MTASSGASPVKESGLLDAQRRAGGRVPGENPVPNLLRGLGEPEQLAVLLVDDALVGQKIKVDGAAPIVRTDVSTSNSSSSVPKPPGKATSALARSRKCSLRTAK